MMIWPRLDIACKFSRQWYDRFSVTAHVIDVQNVSPKSRHNFKVQIWSAVTQFLSIHGGLIKMLVSPSLGVVGFKTAEVVTDNRVTPALTWSYKLGRHALDKHLYIAAT
jgi:hypothetical protein